MVESLQERIAPLKNKAADTILVHEIYASVQGESTYVGVPCVFVRTTACHLRCTYCDTRAAFYHGQEMLAEQIMQRVRDFGIPLVEITGGEPLLQPQVLPLMAQLCDAGFEVLLETSGGVSIANVDKRVRVILDVKTPGSGEADRNIWKNLDILWPGCEVKFVICDAVDYEFAKKILFDHDLSAKATVLFSHEAQRMNGAQLAEWIVRDRLPARFQTQLHKVLWGDKPGV